LDNNLTNCFGFDVARLTVSQAGVLGRDSEAVWGIWLLKELQQRIPKTLSVTLLANSGGLVLSFLAHFRKHGLAGDRNLYSNLRDIVDGDPFAGASWPLSLELTHLAEDDAKWSAAATSAVLRTLHDAKISIIDWDALPKVFVESPTGSDDGDEGRPSYAIEDYGSDYEDGGEDEDTETLFLPAPED
jgi:hypothetical protein